MKESRGTGLGLDDGRPLRRSSYRRRDVSPRQKLGMRSCAALVTWMEATDRRPLHQGPVVAPRRAIAAPLTRTSPPKTSPTASKMPIAATSSSDSTSRATASDPDGAYGETYLARASAQGSPLDVDRPDGRSITFVGQVAAGICAGTFSCSLEAASRVSRAVDPVRRLTPIDRHDEEIMAQSPSFSAVLALGSGAAGVRLGPLVVRPLAARRLGHQSMASTFPITMNGIVAPLLGEQPPVEWLWSQHNEHPDLSPLAWSISPSRRWAASIFRAGMYFNVVALRRCGRRGHRRRATAEGGDVNTPTPIPAHLSPFRTGGEHPLELSDLLRPQVDLVGGGPPPLDGAGSAELPGRTRRGVLRSRFLCSHWSRPPLLRLRRHLCALGRLGPARQHPQRLVQDPRRVGARRRQSISAFYFVNYHRPPALPHSHTLPDTWTHSGGKVLAMGLSAATKTSLAGH